MKIKRCLLTAICLLLILSACSEANTLPASNESQTPASITLQSSVYPWDDREIYRSGLITSEQKILYGLEGASVYHLDVTIADDFLSLYGQEQVQYTNTEDQSLDMVYFQLFPNMEGGKSTVSNVTIDGKTSNPVYEDGNSTLRVPLSTPLNPGQTLIIQMDFEVEIPQNAGGNYGLFGYIDDILVLDGFYPAIPVFDSAGWHKGQIPPNSDTTFQDASFYLVKVTAPKNLVIVGSGISVDSKKDGKNQITTFAIGPARDFYMAASRYFDLNSEKIGETTVNSYSIKGHDEGSKIALDSAVNAIKAYNSHFGLYPYTEFDVVATPMQGAYGIEYPGITGINYTLFDTDSTIAGSSAGSMLESVVAHETAHQWFYNVVGDDQQNEPWLDEAMAQYSTGLYYLDEYGQEGFDGYEYSWYSRWDRVNRETIPIGLPAGSYLGKEYSGIVYGRGPIFIETLSQTMGETAFAQFLHDYYQDNKWGITTTESFKKLAEQDCNCDLTSLFEEWVYQN